MFTNLNLKLQAAAQTTSLIALAVIVAGAIRYIIDVYGTEVVVYGIEILCFLFMFYSLYRLRLADLENKRALKRLNETK
jgi:hypothetical protein